uniref:Uncharacterized protein n=1 Tax=uncultured planctomycete 6N14 TaxID=455069 RepID=A9LGT6_9BACT|nr:hypothetical protein 6N14_14 [uncultured planctomycete 6N14]
MPTKSAKEGVQANCGSGPTACVFNAKASMPKQQALVFRAPCLSAAVSFESTASCPRRKLREPLLRVSHCQVSQLRVQMLLRATKTGQP